MNSEGRQIWLPLRLPWRGLLPTERAAALFCSDETKKYIEEQEIELVTYDDLK